MGNKDLPSQKTVVESLPDGTFNVWFKYENVTESFVKKMRESMESHIYKVHIMNMSKKPIDVPQEDVSRLISTLVDTVRMLDKESALLFIKANQHRTDSIGYIPLLWAAAKYTGIPDEAVIQNLEKAPGYEKALYESLITQFQIPLA